MHTRSHVTHNLVATSLRYTRWLSEAQELLRRESASLGRDSANLSLANLHALPKPTQVLAWGQDFYTPASAGPSVQLPPTLEGLPYSPSLGLQVQLYLQQGMVAYRFGSLQVTRTTQTTVRSLINR